jgi:poly(A) polymerase
MSVPLANSEKYRGAVEIVRALKSAGHEAFLVGGCVRDFLRGVEPKDFDVATSARPEQVEKLFSKTIPVGVQFGVQIVLRGDIPYEVATFRTDGDYKDGRHPQGVSFSNPKEDALRRDFTVNGIFYDPISEKVIDYVDGERDLKAKKIRAIGDPVKRFTEDKLRILRAIRFAVNLGFEVEPETMTAIRALAKQIHEVSPERIRDELIKLFTGPDPGRGLLLLDEAGLLPVILPEVEQMKGVQQPPEFHPEGDVFIHTKLVLDQVPNAPVPVALGALLHDIGKPPTFKIAERIRFDGHDRVGMQMAVKICKRLKFSNDQTDAIAEVVGGHMRFKDVKQMRLATLKRFMAKPTFSDELAMHRADCMASHKDISNWEFLKQKLLEIPAEQIKPKPLLTGTDLLNAGYPAGPEMGRILKAVEEKQLEQELTGADEALAWVKKEFKKS